MVYCYCLQPGTCCGAELRSYVFALNLVVEVDVMAILGILELQRRNLSGPGTKILPS